MKNGTINKPTDEPPVQEAEPEGREPFAYLAILATGREFPVSSEHGLVRIGQDLARARQDDGVVVFEDAVIPAQLITAIVPDDEDDDDDDTTRSSVSRPHAPTRRGGFLS